MTDLLMGIPGVGEIYPGMHVCALFSGPVERDRLLAQFVQEGLRHGDQCVCFIDELEPARLRRGAFGPDGVGDTRRPGSLAVYSAPDAYLRAGEPAPRQRISRLASDPGSSADGALPLLRAAGQMSACASHDPGTTEFARYEAAVVRILAELPAVFLCLYDMRRIGVHVLAEVLKAHSRVLLDGTVLYNPHGVTPPDHPESTSGAGGRGTLIGQAHGADPWRSLTGAEVRIAGLVGAGMTNRATAEELIVSPHTVDAHLKHIYQKLGIHSRTELAVLSFRHGSPAD
ncbi:MEDS domain-containing protein [Microbacterium sp. NPDC078428]|uniref:MEDS domain-containing protein n=1 Tax=Microbacterium sp. NPDC078428 TaxID=3364190 RepID=UPI0037C810B1